MGRLGKVTLFVNILILCAILFISPKSVSAKTGSNGNSDSYLKNNRTSEDGMYGYILSNDKSSACITNYYGPTDIKKLIIPDTIDGYPVISIGGERSIIVESYPFGTFDNQWSLSYIPYALFERCNNLEEIKLPKQLEWIGASAFSSTKLKKVVLPDTVTYIGAGAFASCWQLEEVTLSKNVEIIERYAFHFAKIKEIILPDSLLRIGDEVFAMCRQLEKVDFGKNISYLGDNVFDRTPWLANRGCPEYDMLNDFVLLKYNGCSKTPVVPKGTICIVNNAFEDKPITAVTIPSTVKYIGACAFDNCVNLKEIILPEGLERIGIGAFSGSGLTKITIPDSVADMGRFLFVECGDLKEINLSKNLKDIDYAGFRGTPWLKDREKDEFVIINDTLLLKYNGSSKYPVIPKGIESIAEEAFFRKPLEFIEIPATVKYIGGEAFSQTGLENIYFNGNAPEIVRTPFTVKLINCEDELYTKVYYKDGMKGFDDGSWDIYEPETYTTHTITFDPKNGDKKTVVKVYTGQTMKEPKVIKKGYILDGWYKDGKKFKFDTKIKSDCTLTAKWKVAPKKNIIYIVKKGDTIKKIANKYHTTVAKIAKANGIKNVNRINIGQKLIIGQTP